MRYRVCFSLAKHVVYPILLKRTRLFPPVTRLFVLLNLLYWAGTLVYNFFHISSLATAGQRAGILAVINFALTIMFWSLTTAASLLGFAPRSAHVVHGSLGIMALLQAVVHVAVQLQLFPFSTSDTTQLSGLLVCHAIF